MVSRKSRIARWAVVVVFVAAFVGYRIADPGMPEPPTRSAPRATTIKEKPLPVAQRTQAKALVQMAKDGKPVREQRAALREYLRANDISARSIRTVLDNTEDGIALWPGKAGARTRLGGDPVLPVGVEWPTNPNELPFRFIGAFDFAELPRMEPLPRAGTLALYWDFEQPTAEGDRDFVAGTRAYFIPPGTPSNSPVAPAASFPITYKPLRGTRVPIAGNPNLVADELDGRADAERVYAAMNELRGRGIDPHHLLGTPVEVQGPVLERIPDLLDAENEALAPESRARYTPAERASEDEWMLLAQVEEQDDLVIADGGVLYFVIPRGDLEARRFDRVIGIIDSH